MLCLCAAFHFECICKWARIKNVCPACKARFNRIARLALPAASATAAAARGSAFATSSQPSSASALSQQQQQVVAVLEEVVVPDRDAVVDQPTAEELRELEARCYVCGRGDREDQLLLYVAHS
jgi:hypothetical protein